LLRDAAVGRLGWREKAKREGEETREKVREREREREKERGRNERE